MLAALSVEERDAVTFLADDHRRLVYNANQEILTAELAARRDFFDRVFRSVGFEPYRGYTVRSVGERMIADWLFLNGVNYIYEQPYIHDVADADHAQYRPDFYYPDVDVWHEHWALRADGTPPPSFTGYAESMAWKKETHRHYGTTLIETTWHEIVTLSGFDAFAADLRSHGVRLDWNPDRAIPGVAPLEHDRLAQLVRTFLSHVKSGSFTREDRLTRLGHRPSPRTRLFLDLFWQIYDRWEQDLRDSSMIDFDDMLLQAAAHLERDPKLATYDLIMVDEFQDTSRARARLIRAVSPASPPWDRAVASTSRTSGTRTIT